MIYLGLYGRYCPKCNLLRRALGKNAHCEKHAEFAAQLIERKIGSPTDAAKVIVMQHA